MRIARTNQVSIPPSRRAFLSACATMPWGLDLFGLLHARAEGQPLARRGLPPLRACVVIFYYGGPSQLETFDPKPDAPLEVRGEFRTIDTRVPGIHIAEHTPRLAGVMDKLAIIRSMHHANRLHDSASMESLTGRKPPQGDAELMVPTPQVFPSWGGVVSYMLRARRLPVAHAALPFVFHNVFDVPCQGAGFLGSAYDPYRIEVDAQSKTYQAELLRRAEHVNERRQVRRRDLLEALDAWVESPSGARLRTLAERAFQLLETDAVRRALELEREDPRVRERYGAPGDDWQPGGTAIAEHAYGRNMRGQNLLVARRLVEAGVPFVNVYDFKQQGQNWDTHVKNCEQHRELLLPPMDRSLSALVEDLDARGLLESTLVIGLGEFGRTPRLNANGGRDHWPDCYSIVLAGGGVRGGTVFGASDRLAAYPALDPVSPADLAATVFWRFGIDPSSEIRDEQGRPFVLSEGRPIVELFG